MRTQPSAALVRSREPDPRRLSCADDSLSCKLTEVDPKSDEFAMIRTYTENTQVRARLCSLAPAGTCLWPSSFFHNFVNLELAPALGGGEASPLKPRSKRRLETY